MMPYPRRYQRLIALDDSQLDLTLQALSLTRTSLSLPPRKRHVIHSPRLFPSLHSTITATPPAPPPILSDRMIRAIVTAAAREKRRDLARKSSNPASHHIVKPPRKALAKPVQLAPPPQPVQTVHEADPEEDLPRTEFRTARSRLPIKRRAGMQSKRRPQRVLKPLHKRPCVGKSPAPDSGKSEKDVPEVPNVEPRLVEAIMSEMLEQSPDVDWDDIAGLAFAKNCVMEAVVWPMLRPDIFTGLRGPPKGLLLFGPPGTGKTMIGRAIASKSGAKFFNISASSLVSKWAGEGEKTVRALFAVARYFQPAVVFIDEIDSLLTSRSEGEQEFSRRIKTEFLVQMDGAGTSREDRVLVVGATNRPQELDEAARRRLVKRLYIPLPEHEARVSLTKRLLEKQVNQISEDDAEEIAKVTKGYSGSDMYALCAEAALAPVRELGSAIKDVDVAKVRPVAKADFLKAARMVRASVGEKDLAGYREWNDRFGSFPCTDDGDGTNV